MQAPHPILPALLATLAVVSSPRAQGDHKGQETPPAHLDREAIAARLESFKESILAKMIPEAYRDDPLKKKRWLDRFHIVQSPHYLVFTNAHRGSAQKFQKTLEELYRTIVKRLPFDELDHKMVAYVFKSTPEYYDFCSEVAGWDRKRAEGTAGHASGAYYATYYQSPRSAVVFHEATHQIVFACLKVPGVGSWFQEGMAVYFEKLMTNARVSAGWKGIVRRGKTYGFEEFFALQSLLFDPNKGSRDNYGQAGAVIDFLMNTKLDPVASKFSEFLDAAQKGRGFARGGEVAARLVREVYGLSVQELEALWRRHLGLR